VTVDQINSVVPCFHGDKCSWPACNPHCDGRPGNVAVIRAEPVGALPLLLQTLRYYADTYCEGWCKENGGTFDDCGGCPARDAIAKASAQS
jgi:hypothetical protein